MWRLEIEYSDKSKIRLTGKQSDISLSQARGYKMLYANRPDRKTTYQRYPKSKYLAMTLDEKIEELEESV